MVESGEELRSLMQRLFRRFGALGSDATPCGMPLPVAHAHALMVLLARGEMAQHELGLELGIDKSNVARLCTKMTTASHCAQRASERDGRSRLVSLTAKGKQLAADVEAASSVRFREVLAAVPAGSRATVLSGLRQLVLALDDVPANGSQRRRASA